MSSSADIKPDNYQVNAKICRLVEKYPCMYDRSHQHYLKKDVVDKAWIKISNEMEDSIPSCKERWRNIRTSFARSINVNKIPSSANRTKPYYLHEELQFLARHITPGIPVSRRSMFYLTGEESETVEVAEESMNGYSAMSQDEDSQEQFNNIYENNEFNATVQQSLNESHHHKQKKAFAFDDNDSESNGLSCPPKKRLRSTLTTNMSPANEVVEKEVQNALNYNTDFDAIFLQGILPEMKLMDFRQKLLFKRRIYEVISEIFDDSTPQTLPSEKEQATNSKNITMNASDMAMIRRLSNLLQTPNVPAVSAASSKNISSTSSTIRSSPQAAVTIHRGAQTRSSSNLLNMTQQPSSTSRTSNNVNITPQPHIVKDEPEQNE